MSLFQRGKSPAAPSERRHNACGLIFALIGLSPMERAGAHWMPARNRRETGRMAGALAGFLSIAGQM
jgi:hypothetical protein